jgi:hypothetical protein
VSVVADAQKTQHCSRTREGIVASRMEATMEDDRGLGERRTGV